MDELRADVEALEEAMDDLTATVDRLAEVEGDDGADVADEDLGRAWFDAVVEHRFHGLMLTDLRWELEEGGRAAPDDAGDTGATAGIEARFGELDDRRDTIGERLDGLTRGEWLRRYAGDLSTLDREFSAVEPPIDWEAVSETLEEHRGERDEG